jgi:hypothetical protein
VLGGLLVLLGSLRFPFAPATLPDTGLNSKVREILIHIEFFLSSFILLK